MQGLFLAIRIVAIAALGVVSCSTNQRPVPAVVSSTPHARAPLCPGGGDGYFATRLAASFPNLKLNDHSRAELAASYRETDDNGCLTLTERLLTWKGDTLEFQTWRLDARRQRMSFPPFIADEPTPAGRRTRVVNQLRGFPCYAVVSPSRDFVAWPERGACEPPEICIARVGGDEGTCFVVPEDRRPALQMQIDEVLSTIDRFFWLERDETDYRCIQWTVATPRRLAWTEFGSPGLDVEVRAIRREGSLELRLSAGLVSDWRLPGVHFVEPSKAEYESGQFVRESTSLCETPIGIHRVDETALWTDRGPWYRTRTACEASLAIVRDDARRSADLSTLSAGCDSA